MTSITTNSLDNAREWAHGTSLRFAPNWVASQPRSVVRTPSVHLSVVLTPATHGGAGGDVFRLIVPPV